MRISIIGLCVLTATGLSCASTRESSPPPAARNTHAEQQILDLSRTKWRWMAERNVDSLSALFHEDAVFVHMGGTLSRSRELDVIRSGAIQYKQADIQEATVQLLGTTAILLNRIRLVAVVGGNEIVNPFMVTEVYVQRDGAWKLGSLSFTRLLTSPVPLSIEEQGSFAVGGTVARAPGTFDPIAQGAYTPTPDPTGQTLHGDHAYVFYQKPANARPLPLVFWHGHGQSAKTWETTPDGREGFQNIFLRYGYPVYLLDQPRRGRAARSTAPGTIPATPDEQMWFGIFRLGVWPTLYPGVQFAKDSSALHQFFRQMVPNTGPYDVTANTSAVAALFEKIGPGILVTHSQSGTLGWRTGIRSRNIRAIVSYEPGGDFIFPEGEAPSVSFGSRTLTPPTVPLSDFLQLTKVPIIVYYGDSIPEQPSTNPGREQWRVFRVVARAWRDAVNRRGGNVTLIDLPAIGIRGNTHFPMSDLNNVEVANHLASWLREKGLDR